MSVSIPLGLAMYVPLYTVFDSTLFVPLYTLWLLSTLWSLYCVFKL